MARALPLLAAGCVALPGCGGAGAGGGQGSLSGSIAIDGSSTVGPISEAMAEEFRTVESGIQVTVETSGTGGGFKRFCAGEIDIADASRPIKAEEQAACAAEGIDYTELRVGLDGLVIATSSRNRFLRCLSLEQLALVFEEGGADTWDQVDPAFPGEDVDIFAPGTDSGTYDFFVEEVLGAPDKPGSTKARTDYTASEDDNTLVQGVAGQRNSWGFFGFAYFTENRSRLKAVAVSEDTGGECVTPSDETVEAGDYPLSRPLFIYVRNESLRRPAVKEFVRFYLETTPDIVGDVGYTPAPAEDYERGLELVEQVG